MHSQNFSTVLPAPTLLGYVPEIETNPFDCLYEDLPKLHTDTQPVLSSDDDTINTDPDVNKDFTEWELHVSPWSPSRLRPLKVEKDYYLLGNDRVVIFANTPDPEYFDSIGTDSLSPAPVEEANKTPTGNKHWVPMSCLKKTRSFESRRHIAPRVRFSMPDSPSGTIKNKCSHKTSNPAWFLSNSDDASRILETSNSLPTTTAASESPSKVPVGRRSNYDIRSKQESHYCLEIEALRDQQQELRGKYNKLRVMLTSFKEGQITKSSSDGKRLHSMLTNQQNQHLICQNAVIFGASLIPHSLETPYCQHSTTFSNRKNYPRTTHTNGRSRVNPKKFNHESSINLRLLKLVKGL